MNLLAAIRRTFQAISIFGCVFSFANTSMAQVYPTKPIKLIVPYSAGGTADAATRAVAAHLSTALGQPAIVENKPGASGIIGTDFVAKSPPDGYTLALISNALPISAALATVPRGTEILGVQLPYDVVKDFALVAGIGQIRLALVVPPSLGVKNLSEFASIAKQGKVNFVTLGPGHPFFVHMHRMSHEMGVTFTEVPYRGQAAAMTDLMAGSVQAAVLPVQFAAPYVQSGKLVAIATSGEKRHPMLPDVPTFVESGYPQLAFGDWLAIAAPAQTPKPVVNLLYEAIAGMLSTPASREKYQMLIDPEILPPNLLAERLKMDLANYGAIIKVNVK